MKNKTTDRHITINIEVVDDDVPGCVLQTAQISVTVPPIEEPEPPKPDTWTVRIEFGDDVFEVEQDAALECGTFASTYAPIYQRCYRAYYADHDLTIWFRPEEDGSRQEIIFERSCCELGDSILSCIGPYTVYILNGERLVHQALIKEHYAFTRWRWQSAPRPIIATIAKLLQDNLIPPYPFNGNRSAVAVPIPYEPLGLAGVYPQMPNAGERPDIGLMTDPQAEYCVTESGTSLLAVMNQGEASGSIPWHMRDELTTAPINFEARPQACWYQGQGKGDPFVVVPPHPTIKVDSSHQPALCYLPYLLTGDPYYLEGLQFQATWNHGSKSIGYRPTLSETRQFAWDVRTLGQCAVITPDGVPLWLLPVDYWRRLSMTYCNYFTNTYTNSKSRLQSVFRATDNVNAQKADAGFPQGTWCAPWQSEFLTSVLGWLTSMGLECWRYEFEWLAQGALDRTAGIDATGWPRALCTPYHMMLQMEKNGEPAHDYTEAWQINQDIAGLAYTVEDVWEQDDLTYLSYTRGSLVYAQLHGLNVGDRLEWATGQMTLARYTPAFKWSISPDLKLGKKF